MRGAMIWVVLLASPAMAETTPHREGDYGGVIPGQTARPDPGPRPVKAKRPPPKGTLSWIGFEAKEGGAAEVFFQSAGPFDVTQRLDGSTLVVSLDLQKLGSNTWRAVDTRFFDNPLAGVAAKQGKSMRGKGRRGVEVRIHFKNPKDAREGTLRSATEADGMYYVYLAFPPGTDAGPSGSATSPGTVSEPE
jgi:hypothetical protein